MLYQTLGNWNPRVCRTKWRNRSGKQCGGSSKAKIRITLWPNNPTSGYIRRTERRSVDTHAGRSITHSTGWEGTKGSLTDEWITCGGQWEGSDWCSMPTCVERPFPLQGVTWSHAHAMAHAYIHTPPSHTISIPPKKEMWCLNVHVHTHTNACVYINNKMFFSVFFFLKKSGLAVVA